MVRSLLLVSGLAALVAAIPQQAEHISRAQVSRLNNLFVRDNAVAELAGRAVTQDGSCGSASGLTCRQGDCCSTLGWCGSTPLHCGTGCQAGFGKCGTDGSSTVVPDQPVQVAAVKQDPPAAPVNAPVVNSVVDDKPPKKAPAAPVTPQQPQPQQQSGPKSNGLGNTYTLYKGDGTPSTGWPTQDKWVDFETAFANNKPVMQSTCMHMYPDVPGMKDNSEADIQAIHDAILTASTTYNVDARFILAVVLQESNGCIRAKTTHLEVDNPGLMQTYKGKATCYDGVKVSVDCPASMISAMITEGVAGTGPGSMSLIYALSKAPGSDASKYYQAGRIYNSGSITGPLETGPATHCYSTDIANRLTGWVNTSHTPCTL